MNINDEYIKPYILQSESIELDPNLSIDKIIENKYKINIESIEKDAIFVIIALKNIKISGIVSSRSVIIISPQVLFNKEKKIVFQMKQGKKGDYRPFNEDEHYFYGLDGLPGKNGLDVEIYTISSIEEEILQNVLFISKGGDSGMPQNGNPIGKEGVPGLGGKLSLNRKVLIRGETGDVSKYDESYYKNNKMNTTKTKKELKKKSFNIKLLEDLIYVYSKKYNIENPLQIINLINSK